jgi:hypothetical protein
MRGVVGVWAVVAVEGDESVSLVTIECRIGTHEQVYPGAIAAQ